MVYSNFNHADLKWRLPAEEVPVPDTSQRRMVITAGIKQLFRKFQQVQGCQRAQYCSPPGQLSAMSVLQHKHVPQIRGYQSLVEMAHDGEHNEFWYYWLSQNTKELIKRANGSTFAEIGKSEVQEMTPMFMRCFANVVSKKKKDPVTQMSRRGLPTSTSRRLTAASTCSPARSLPPRIPSKKPSSNRCSCRGRYATGNQPHH